MLRDPKPTWWRRLFGEELAPAYIHNASPAANRRCPECSESYDARDRYCPRCHTATPEWRYG